MPVPKSMGSMGIGIIHIIEQNLQHVDKDAFV